MGTKQDNTAVNALIEQVAVGRKPFGAPASSSNDLFSVPPSPKPLPRSRSPQGTRENAAMPAAARVRVTDAQPARAMSIPPLASANVIAASDVRARLPLVSPPSIPPLNAPMTLPAGESDKWFTESASSSKQITTEAFRTSMSEGTVQVQRPRPGDGATGEVVRKVVGPLAILLVLGVFVGGYFAFDGDGNTSKAKTTTTTKATKAAPEAKPQFVVAATEPELPAKAAASEPAKVEEKPAPVAVVDEPVAPVPAGAEVEVRIDSKPSGATVMLVDAGKTTFLGSTPLSATIDSSRSYDLVFTKDGSPTKIAKLDPKAEQRVAVVLDGKAEPKQAIAKTEVSPKPEAVEAPKLSKADLAREKRHAARAARKAKAAEAKKAAALDSFVETKPAKPAKAAVADVGGEGTLAISSKPPCEIIVDGKATGLMSPQRSIALPAGAHKVTLVNSAENIKKTFTVQITADKSTRLIQDLMKK